MMRVAVIGGGLTGLSAAYHLTKWGHEVVLLEKEPYLGGLASSWNVDGHNIERYYHHINSKDSFFINFLDELGLSNTLEWRHASSGYHFQGEIYRTDTVVDMLRFKGLGLGDIIRLGVITLLGKFRVDFAALDHISAREWILEHGSSRLYSNFFEPLLRGKFGDRADEISAAWLLGRIKFRAGRSASGEKLGYMRGGFQVLIDKMEERILENGGEIRRNAPARLICREGTFRIYTSPDDDLVEADEVVSTISPRILRKISSFWVDIGIEYQGTVCALLELNMKLMEGIYWLNIKHDNLPFGALVEHTNFYPIGDRNFLYVASYNQELLNPPDHKVVSLLVEGIRELFPDFHEDSVLRWWLARDTDAAPLYKKNYLSDMKNINSVDGLHITGMFRSYPERSMGDSLRLGYEVAKKLGTTK